MKIFNALDSSQSKSSTFADPCSAIHQLSSHMLQLRFDRHHHQRFSIKIQQLLVQILTSLFLAVGVCSFQSCHSSYQKMSKNTTSRKSCCSVCSTPRDACSSCCCSCAPRSRTCRSPGGSRNVYERTDWCTFSLIAVHF